MLELRAPQVVVLKDLANKTVGAVVQPGTVLLNLIPADEPLQAEVKIGVIGERQICSRWFQRSNLKGKAVRVFKKRGGLNELKLLSSKIRELTELRFEQVTPPTGTCPRPNYSLPAGTVILCEVVY